MGLEALTSLVRQPEDQVAAPAMRASSLSYSDCVVEVDHVSQPHKETDGIYGLYRRNLSFNVMPDFQLLLLSSDIRERVISMRRRISL